MIVNFALQSTQAMIEEALFLTTHAYQHNGIVLKLIV